mmetsp:Transcript_109676/g.189986  ORF Transcript_109676/g.189986 Transcript_109676/m.189986 type:complete len:389 (-) Transcript_109676:624-1790(-)
MPTFMCVGGGSPLANCHPSSTCYQARLKIFTAQWLALVAALVLLCTFLNSMARPRTLLARQQTFIVTSGAVSSVANRLLPQPASPGASVLNLGITHGNTVGHTPGKSNPQALMQLYAHYEDEDPIAQQAPASPSTVQNYLSGGLALVLALAMLLRFAAPAVAAPARVVSEGPEYVSIATEDGLGVAGGDLAFCTPTACISSQDDRPAVWAEPWEYEGPVDRTQDRLLDAIEAAGGNVIRQEGRYIRAEFRDVLTGALDVAEFYFTPNDNTIQFRSARQASGVMPGLPAVTDFGANARRMEQLRIRLGLEKLPVLRYRKRALFAIESPFDDFGPDTNDLYGIDPADVDLSAGRFEVESSGTGFLDRLQQRLDLERDDHIDAPTYGKTPP